jgi:hypothetical protein
MLISARRPFRGYLHVQGAPRSCNGLCTGTCPFEPSRASLPPAFTCSRAPARAQVMPRSPRLLNELPASMVEIVTTAAAFLKPSGHWRDQPHRRTHKGARLNPHPRACSRASGPACTIPTPHPAPQTGTCVHVHAHSTIAHAALVCAHSHAPAAAPPQAIAHRVLGL